MTTTPKTRRTYSGNAVETTTTGSFAEGATTVSITASTGWPAAGPFYAVIDPSTAKEEKILVGSITGTSLSNITRGVDGTSDVGHSSGAIIYPVFTSIDANEANELVATYQNEGGIVYLGDPSFSQLAIGTAGQVLKVNSGADAPEWGQVGSAGIAIDAVTNEKLANNSVNTSEIVDSAVTTAKIEDAAVTTAKIASASLQLLAPAGSITSYIGATAPTGWLLCDGSTVSSGQTLYPNLWAVLPDSFKSGANIVLPNMKGRVVVGLDSSQTEFDALGETGGSKTSTAPHTHDISHGHSLTGGGENHTHPQRVVGVSVATGGVSITVTGDPNAGPGDGNFSTATASSHSHSVSSHSGNSGASSAGATSGNLQPYITMNYIIKT